MSDPIMQKLDEMQARCDAATEGPWAVEFAGDFGDQSAVILCSRWRGSDSMLNTVGFGEDVDTARFVASARTDMPKLIDALKAVLEEHGKSLWHTEECTHWPDMDCDCIELENGDWYEPHIGYFVCETCSGDVTCHGSADHTVEYPCPTVEAITKALGVEV